MAGNGHSASKPAQRSSKRTAATATSTIGGQASTSASTSTQARIRHAASNTQKPRPDAGVKPKTLWNSWMSISPSTRMKMGLVAGVFAIGGVLAADKLEASYPSKSNRPLPPPSSSTSTPILAKELEENHQIQTQSRPKLFGISIVDKEK